MMDHDKMLNISRIIRTTCATAPVCRIRLKISPPENDAKTGATPDPAMPDHRTPKPVRPGPTTPELKKGATTPPAIVDANKGNCEFIIAKSTASIS
jgi:hypothetical protein